MRPFERSSYRYFYVVRLIALTKVAQLGMDVVKKGSRTCKVQAAYSVGCNVPDDKCFDDILQVGQTCYHEDV
jgi:hypothetical protein